MGLTLPKLSEESEGALGVTGAYCALSSARNDSAPGGLCTFIQIQLVTGPYGRATRGNVCAFAQGGIGPGGGAKSLKTSYDAARALEQFSRRFQTPRCNDVSDPALSVP